MAVLGYQKLTLPTASTAASTSGSVSGGSVTDGSLSTKLGYGGASGGVGALRLDFAFPAFAPGEDRVYAAIVAVMNVSVYNSGLYGHPAVTCKFGTTFGGSSLYSGTRTVTRYPSRNNNNAFFVIAGHTADASAAANKRTGGIDTDARYLRIEIPWSGSGGVEVGEVMVFRGFYADVEPNRRIDPLDDSIVQKSFSGKPYVSTRSKGRAMRGTFNNLRDIDVFGGLESSANKLATLTEVAYQAGRSGDVVFVPDEDMWTGNREPAWQNACMYGKLTGFSIQEDGLRGGGGDSVYKADFSIEEITA